MSHKVYPNLAHLESFPSDLNYTGIPLDGWNDPTSLVPVVLVAFYVVFMGFPKSFTEWWLLICGCIIHPWMEGIIGQYGVGMKYLVDEYAILDSRFWPTKDPAVMVVAAMELWLETPLCAIWYYTIKKNCWSQHFYACLCSMLQLTGAILYMGPEIYENYIHLPAHDSLLSPRFDSYNNLKYFWFIFIFMNSLWIVIPCWLTWRAYFKLAEPFNQTAAKKNK